MNLDRIDVVVSAQHGPRARYRPLVLGPLAVHRLQRSVESGHAEHLTTIARALAGDLHAQLANVPTLDTIGDLAAGVRILEAQIERLRVALEGEG